MTATTWRKQAACRGLEVEVFYPVTEDEADAAQGKVSWVSPAAAALLAAHVGDEVAWRRPAGDLLLRVVAIDYPES